MKLEERKEALREEYICELTKELDVLAKLTSEEVFERFRHYIVADDLYKKEKCLAIRVPGGTVGGIYLDDNNVITKIYIDTDYVVKSYPSDVNEIIEKKFVGEVIEY